VLLACHLVFISLKTLEIMKKLNLALICLVLLPLFSFQNPSKRAIKVALILDTSNSMDGLIDQAKSQLWSIVNELSSAKCDGQNPEIKIALYEYGNDKLSMREGYIRLVSPFTNDLDLISEKLFALRTDGGSEFCGQVIQSSLKQLDWEDYPKDLKMIFIAGNEPFDQGNVSYREVCKTARQKDITVNTIFCGNFQEGVGTNWKDGAYIGGGDYLNIDQDCNYVYIKSPYDDRILELNLQLNKTYIPYGLKGEVLCERQTIQDKNAFSINEGIAIKRAASKSKSIYNNSQWDLVDALNDDVDIESVEKEYLPEEMKNMSREEMLELITKKSEERIKVANEIDELTKKRDKFVAEKQNDETVKMLDSAIVQSVKKQAVAKGFVF
jgi:hypothetical protein